MSSRQLGQETPNFASRRRGSRIGLVSLAGLLDWTAIENRLRHFYSAAKKRARLAYAGALQSPAGNDLVRSVRHEARRVGERLGLVPNLVRFPSGRTDA